MKPWLRVLAMAAILVGSPIAARAGWGYYHLCIVDGTPPGSSESASRSLQLFRADMRKIFNGGDPAVVDVASAETASAIFGPGCSGVVRDANAMRTLIERPHDRPYDGVIFYCYDTDRARIWLGLLDGHGNELTHLFVPIHTAPPLMGAGDMRGLVLRPQRQALLKFLVSILPYSV